MDVYIKYHIMGFTHDLGLNINEVSELYAELIAEINSAILELKILIVKQDSEKIKKIIHNIKGVSGNYRITDIYEKTTQINDSLKTNNYNALETDLNDLFSICDIAIKEIKKFFEQRSISIDTHSEKYTYVHNPSK